MIATAGHCIRNQYKCDNTAFIFDFMQRSGNIDPEMDNIPENNVYMCSSIKATFKKNPFDFALVNLDRPVVSRIPIPVNQQNNLHVGQPLAVIGHPVGLPMKIAGGAEVKLAVIWGKYNANLDTTVETVARL